MKINEYEAGMLDATLEAFGSGEQLNREQILELFGDDALAAAMVNLLINAELVSPAGAVGQGGLPANILRNAKAIDFLSQGGFTEHYLNAGTQTDTSENTIQTPDIKEDKSITESTLIVPESNFKESVSAPFIDETNFPEPALTPATWGTKTDEPPSADALQAEVFKLRKDKMQADYIIRQKDDLITTLQAKEEQLAKVNIYLVIAIAAVVGLIIWLIIHYLKH